MFPCPPLAWPWRDEPSHPNPHPLAHLRPSCPLHCPQHPHPILTQPPAGRLMTWGGGEPTCKVSPDNGVWGRLDGRGHRGEEPPRSPVPPAEVISSPAFHAASAGHPPPARRDEDARWRVGTPAPGRSAAAALAPGRRATLGTGKGGRAQRGGLSMDTACPLFTAFNNKAVAIATGLINASDLHN